MQELYNNPQILEYLRFHPRWYKILYYDPSLYQAFLNEAKEKLHIRTVDKLENVKNQINFISSLSNYIAKK